MSWRSDFSDPPMVTLNARLTAQAQSVPDSRYSPLVSVVVVFCVVTVGPGRLLWVVVVVRETSVGGGPASTGTNTAHAATHRLPTRIIVEIYTAVVSFLLVTTSR